MAPGTLIEVFKTHHPQALAIFQKPQKASAFLYKLSRLLLVKPNFIPSLKNLCHIFSTNSKKISTMVVIS